MTIASLATEVQTRFSPDMLKQLTNYDPVATTINTTVLNVACADAIGEFERITGMAHDTSIASHVSILIHGVIYFLETYKNRDNEVLQSRMKRFYAACENMRKIVWIPAQSTSNIKPSRDAVGSTPDMDRSKVMWRPGNMTSSPQEYSDFGDS